MMVKKILVCIWNKSIDILILLKKYILNLIDNIRVLFIRHPNVKSIDDTIDKILEGQISVSRYGDGELKLVNGRDISFQKYSPELSKRLKEILVSNKQNHIVCIPNIFTSKSRNDLQIKVDKAWKQHLTEYRLKWYKNLNIKNIYFDANISRCYIGFKDKNKSKEWFKKIITIWKNREIIIVEGELSRLGVGNDLFNNSKSIQRVLAPTKNAYDKYDNILSFLKKQDRSKLIIIALGPTATVLAYDLHNVGFQAIDLGHLDIEYEWFLKGATKMIPIKNKYVNEAGGLDKNSDNKIEANYYKQIIADFSN